MKEIKMKKVLLALFTLALCFSSLFANEAAVKQIILRNAKLTSEGKLEGILSNYTKDYIEIDLDSDEKISYNDMQLIGKALDGKHPEEFMIIAFEMENERKPNAEEMKALREMINNDEFKKEYSNICKQMIEMTKKSGALQLKTMKFITVSVKGSNAVAVIEYEDYDVTDARMKKVIKKSETLKLRKVNGVWMFCGASVKKISK